MIFIARIKLTLFLYQERNIEIIITVKITKITVFPGCKKRAGKREKTTF